MVLNHIEMNGWLYWAPKVVGSRVEARLAQDQGYTNPRTGTWVRNTKDIRLEAQGGSAKELSALNIKDRVRVEGKLRFYKTGTTYIQVTHIEKEVIKPL